MRVEVFLYILVMAAVTYLIRMLPLTLIRRKITNRTLRSFLYYVPYATLSAMTFPANCMPLCAMEDLPWETICQEWPGVPAASVTALICAVGHTQLTSPTSVDPFKHSSVSISGTMKSLITSSA